MRSRFVSGISHRHALAYEPSPPGGVRHLPGEPPDRGGDRPSCRSLCVVVGRFHDVQCLRMCRGGIAGILLNYGEAVARFKKIGLCGDRLAIVAAGGIEIAFDQISCADSRIAKTRPRGRLCVLPPGARRLGSPRWSRRVAMRSTISHGAFCAP